MDATLREREETFRSAQDASPDGFTILRPVRDAHGRVVDFIWVYENATIARLNGTDPEAVVGKRLLELFPSHAGSHFLKAYQQVAETGEQCIFEDEYKGETITTSTWFRIIVVPARDDIAILAQDITDRKQAEAGISRLNAELQRANKELEAFAYSVSHDLRAPLRHLMGFANLLATNTRANLDEASQGYLSSIAKAATRMAQLIDALLDFSRAGRVAMHEQSVDLNALVREVVEVLRPDTEKRQVRWQIAALPRAYGDVDLLRAMLTNLLSNALKFTRLRDEAKIQVGCTENEREVIVSIRDNGVGFDMKHVGKLFGVFQRLHSMQQFEGTGIGLANVRRIIDRHGGCAWAESVQNEGAIFYFSLPKPPAE